MILSLMIFDRLQNMPISSSSCFTAIQSLNRMSTTAKTAKQSLKYSYPGLWLFDKLVLQGNYNILTKTAVFRLKSHGTTSLRPLPELIWERYHTKTTQPFFRSSCEWHLTLWNFFLDIRFWMLFHQEATKYAPKSSTAKTASLAHISR